MNRELQRRRSQRSVTFVCRVPNEKTKSLITKIVPVKPEAAPIFLSSETRSDAELRGSDEFVSSLAAQVELDAGEFPKQTEMLELLAKFPLLDLNEAVAEAVDAYIARQVMPNDRYTGPGQPGVGNAP